MPEIDLVVFLHVAHQARQGFGVPFFLGLVVATLGVAAGALVVFGFPAMFRSRAPKSTVAGGDLPDGVAKSTGDENT